VIGFSPTADFLLSNPSSYALYIGLHWGHETFCWRSVEMSLHESILRDVRNQI
jgi:hypothetical protein